jgi:hypothetical protein
MVHDMPMMKLLASGAICLVLTGEATDILQFGVDGQAILCVPQAELHQDLLAYMDVSLDLQVGSGHAPGFLFLFKAREMKRKYPNYYINPAVPYDDGTDAFSGNVGFTAPEDRIRWGSAMRARNISKIWHRQEPCSVPSVEPMGNSVPYRVKCKLGDLSSSLWTRAPKADEKMPDPDGFVIATCRYKPMIYGPFKGYTLKDCMRTLIIDEFIIDYEFQEENAHLHEEFDQFLRQKIQEWRRNCSI